MDYTPHTEPEIEAMLAQIGASSVEELFEQVPEDLRLGRNLDLPSGMAEGEVLDHLSDLASLNRPAEELVCFAGGGAYDHYIPAPVRHLAYRAEFATSYTPYQPELSQGILTALFEFQTMVCELSGMEVANAGTYDGASALNEAVNLCASATGRNRFVVSTGVAPTHRQVLQTLGAGLGYRLEELSLDGGLTTPGDLNDAACIVVAQPNFLGCIEDLAAISAAAKTAGAMLVVSFDPLSAGVLEAPGRLGADVVVGEGQSLGVDLAYGGPYLGLFATKLDHVRRVPGRIAGATLDSRGDSGFVLTLQAREQHIRREKASSNICTNQTLMAIAATVYLSWLGPLGLREVGETCLTRSHQAAELLSSVPGCSIAFESPFFKEFVLRVPKPATEVVGALSALGFLVGPALGRWYPELEDCLLIASTERRKAHEIEGLAKALAEVVA